MVGVTSHTSLCPPPSSSRPGPDTHTGDSQYPGSHDSEYPHLSSGPHLTSDTRGHDTAVDTHNTQHISISSDTMMRPASLLHVTAFLLSSGVCENMSGVSGPGPRVLADLGGNISLSCASPRPWFFCVWEGPGGGRVCGLSDRLGSDGHEALCGGETRTRISGQIIITHHHLSTRRPLPKMATKTKVW